MQPGDQIRVNGLKADGTVYKWWMTDVVHVQPDLIVTAGYPGETVHDLRGDWTAKSHVLGYYWLDKPYNILVFYDPDRRPSALYANVASAPTIDGNTLSFADYELDVVQHIGEAQPTLLDEDEFREAVVKYGYTAEFQAHCYAVTELVKPIFAAWNWEAWRYEKEPTK